MKDETKKYLKKISKHNYEEEAVNGYLSEYIDESYRYALLQLIFNYYTLKEVADEDGGIASDKASEMAEEVNSILFESLLSDALDNADESIEKLSKIRNDITRSMEILTAYTDKLQIYEYVLNRIEYDVTGGVSDVDVDKLAKDVFNYIFCDNDKMVINSKIQMVTGQLPVRMTKNRFFEYLTTTLNIYKGSEVSSVDAFCDMIKSSTGMAKPEGYGEEFAHIYKTIEVLESTDYKSLDEAGFRAVMEQFSMTASILQDEVSYYLLLMDVINNLYAVILSGKYISNEIDEKANIETVRKIHAVYVAESELTEDIVDGLNAVVGIQEELLEDLMKFEAVLPDVSVKLKEDGADLDKSNALLSVSRLLSNSMFADIDDQEAEVVLADQGYIDSKCKGLTDEFEEFFKVHEKYMNRAVMAAAFSQMPVLFNSTQEVSDYISYSLEHCTDKAELTATSRLLTDMMEEE